MMLGMILVHLDYIDKGVLNQCLLLQLEDLVKDMNEVNQEADWIMSEIQE